jgi:hypothetical protein
VVLIEFKKGVQNLLKMNCFIKEKGNPLFFPPLPWFMAAGPTSLPPPAFRRPKWALSLFPLGLAKLAARPSSWTGSQAKPAQAPASLAR